MRNLTIDRTRGALMILMAVDHASFFIRKVHFSESWGTGFPDYRGWGEFITRFITHPAPTGFLFLMGVGIAYSAKKRNHWQFLGRAGSILTLHFLLEPLLWRLVETNANYSVFRLGAWPGTGGAIGLEFGVLFVLGVGYAFWGLVRNAPAYILGPLSLLMLPAGHWATRFADTLTRQTIWIHPLLLPWRGNDIFVIYPLLPWLGIIGLGLLFGRLLQVRNDTAKQVTVIAGPLFIALWGILRMIGGRGNLYTRPYTDGIARLAVMKYPPSLTYFCYTLGVLFLLMAFFQLLEDRRQDWSTKLSTFGKEPLTFYFAHLALYGYFARFFPSGATLPVMYLVWASGLVPLWWLCLLVNKRKNWTISPRTPQA